MELRLSFLPKFPEATFIQGATFILDSRVVCECPLSANSFMVFFKNSLHQNKCCQGVAKGIVIILEDASLPKDLMNAMLQKLHFPVN